MGKFTDEFTNTLKGYFETGDIPTEAQLHMLLEGIRDGIQEHEHNPDGGADSGTGDAAPISGTLILEDEPDQIGSEENFEEGDTGWTDKDISEHLTAGATGVLLYLTASPGGALSTLSFRRKGVQNAMYTIELDPGDYPRPFYVHCGVNASGVYQQRVEVEEGGSLSLSTSMVGTYY